MNIITQHHTYPKKWISYKDQVDLLSERGLKISNRDEALNFLKHVNYYRFSGYCLAFESERHVFLNGTTLNDIRYAYEFDQHLRSLLAEALAIIEIDLRNIISHTLGEIYGPFGHTNSASFYRRFNHAEWISTCRTMAEKSTELFIDHYRNNYAEFPDIPIWMVAEIVSFGTMSRMYKGMLKKDQTIIARRYHRQVFELATWIHHLVYVRNICTHHARLWDRIWAIKPVLPVSPSWRPPLLPDNGHLFSTLLIISSMIENIPTAKKIGDTWKRKIENLLVDIPSTPSAIEHLGLTKDWMNHPVWSQK